jgi:AcrR family transcriptional regulator
MAGSTSDSRQQIALAAIQMFRQYGYAKTTVADIAKACSMSPANIYRFYPSKDAIVEEIARDYMNQKQQLAREIARRPISASLRLEAFAVEMLQSNLNEFVSEQRLFEIVVMCIEKHRPVVMSHLQDIRAIIASIVHDGVVAGEFTVEHVDETAEAVFNTMCKFHHPQMIAQHLKQPLEDQARSVVRLVCRGLRSPEPFQRAS